MRVNRRKRRVLHRQLEDVDIGIGIMRNNLVRDGWDVEEAVTMCPVSESKSNQDEEHYTHIKSVAK